MTEPPAIQLNKLQKRYHNGVLALAGIDLEIKHGSIVGYLGPNGAGKTTTMKILSNLIRPTSGTALIDGVDVQQHSKQALKHVGILLEVPGIYEYLTPVEMMTYSGKIYGLDDATIKKRITETLETVMLSDWADKKVGSFSTGMIRRLMIAQTMVHDPDLFILDEPVMGLDPKGIYDVRQIIKSLKSSGKTIFLSSHLLSEISETCEQVVIINKGKIVVVDNVNNLLINASQEKSNVHVEFLTALSKEQVDLLKSLPNVTLIQLDPSLERGTFTVIAGRKGRSEMLAALLNKGFPVVSYSAVSNELEDVYLSYFGTEAVS